jgi:hypothetical protein
MSSPREAAIQAATEFRDAEMRAATERMRAAYRAYREADIQMQRDHAIAKGAYAQAMTEIDAEYPEEVGRGDRA